MGWRGRYDRRLGIWLAPVDASTGILIWPTSDFLTSVIATGASMDVVVVARPFGPSGRAKRIGFTSWPPDQNAGTDRAAAAMTSAV